VRTSANRRGNRGATERACGLPHALGVKSRRRELEAERLIDEGEPVGFGHWCAGEAGAFDVPDQDRDQVFEWVASVEVTDRPLDGRDIAVDGACGGGIEEEQEVRVEAARIRASLILAAAEGGIEQRAMVVTASEDVGLGERESDRFAVFGFEEARWREAARGAHALHLRVAEVHSEGAAAVRIAEVRLAVERWHAGQGNGVGAIALADSLPCGGDGLDGLRGRCHAGMVSVGGTCGEWLRTRALPLRERHRILPNS